MSQSSLRTMESQLTTIRMALERTLGSSFVVYTNLVESFLAGKLSKEELEGALRRLLEDDNANFDLHNKYIGLILERLAALESVVLTEWQKNKNEPAHCESLVLHTEDIEFDLVDRQLFTESQKAPVMKAPFEFENDTITTIFQEELSLTEKNYGRPLLSAVSGLLPDETSIRAILICWLKAYGLDTNSLEDDHVQIILQALHDYLENVINAAIRGTCGKTTVIEMDHLLAALSHSEIRLSLLELINS